MRYKYESLEIRYSDEATERVPEIACTFSAKQQQQQQQQTVSVDRFEWIRCYIRSMRMRVARSTEIDFISMTDKWAKFI